MTELQGQASRESHPGRAIQGENVTRALPPHDLLRPNTIYPTGMILQYICIDHMQQSMLIMVKIMVVIKSIK
jgi:hypothetical protein